MALPDTLASDRQVAILRSRKYSSTARRAEHDVYIPDEKRLRLPTT